MTALALNDSHYGSYNMAIEKVNKAGLESAEYKAYINIGGFIYEVNISHFNTNYLYY